MSTTTHSVRFDKYHGTGNDFIVVDASESVPDRPAFATTHCDRGSGLSGAEFVSSYDGRRGADGVLFLHMEERYNPTRLVMTLVQPDGSVAAMCGNGARCAARWAHDRTGESEFMIDTPAGTRRASLDGDEVTIEMGSPSFEPRDVPLARDEPLIEEEVEGLTVTALNTGVPHAVAFVESVDELRSSGNQPLAGDVDDVDLESVAPAVRHAEVFPDGANVTVASRVEPEADEQVDSAFRQRTFERGVEGETRSCGTGAVAVVAAAKRLGLVDGTDPVRVSPPGGDLHITVPDRGEATLRGPVEREFEGELAVPDHT